MTVEKDIIDMKDKTNITEKGITEMTVGTAMTEMTGMKDLGRSDRSDNNYRNRS